MKKSMVFEGVAVTLLILLAFLMLAMVVGGSAVKEVSGIGEIWYTYVGDDNTLYVFSGNNVSAIDGSGTQKWTFEVPEQWSVCRYGYYPGILRSDGRPMVYANDPIVSSGDGILYVYLKPLPPGPSAYYMDGALMAISNGRKMWELPITGHNISYPAWGSAYYSDDSQRFSDTKVYASGGRVYVFHDYNETVISENGTILWSIEDVASPPAVDEQGFVYSVRSPAPRAGELTYPYNVYLPDYRTLTDTIDAYYPGGTLYWEIETANPLVYQSTNGDRLPFYFNGMVYAPMYNGITALYANGTIKWTKTYDGTDFKFDWPFDPGNLTESQQNDVNAYERLFKAQMPPGPRLPVQNGIEVSLGLYNAMPFDREGNVYLQCISDIPTHALGYQETRMFLITIGPDGNEVSRTSLYKNTYMAAKDGIGYATEGTIPREGDYALGAPPLPSNVTDLGSNKLIAFDVKSGKELWNYTFTARDPTVATLDRDNIRTLIGGYEAEEAINNSGVDASKLPHSSIGPIVPWGTLQVSPGDRMVYVSFQSINYEDPIVLGQSKCAYVGGIYAFEENGTLEWYKPTPPISNTMQVTQNGTVFYRTPDGKIGVTGAGFAAGFTITAILYLLLRFVCVGAVARAKARLSKNDNRNRVLDFIVKNPGSSLYEIARGTGVNLGTVRYHLFILGLNHKIVASQTDGKYVRYFTNSGTYSKEEQLILSLMRRDAMGRVLSLMLEKPGISNAEIARELEIKESVVCRLIKELSDKGVIAKEPTGRGCSVEEAQRDHVAMAMRRIQGE